MQILNFTKQLNLREKIISETKNKSFKKYSEQIYFYLYHLYLYITEINSIFRNSILSLIIVWFGAFLFKTDFYQQIVLVNFIIK